MEPLGHSSQVLLEDTADFEFYRPCAPVATCSIKSSFRCCKIRIGLSQLQLRFCQTDFKLLLNWSLSSWSSHNLQHSSRWSHLVFLEFCMIANGARLYSLMGFVVLLNNSPTFSMLAPASNATVTCTASSPSIDVGMNAP